MNVTTIHRRIASCAVVAVIFSGLAACGSEVSPPVQNISDKVEKQQRKASVPKRTTGNRFDFGDEIGTAEVPERTARRAGSGTRNRMDFGDEGR